MRKTLFALLVIWTLPHIAWADGSCNSMSKDDCPSTQGCYLDDGGSCMDCSAESFYTKNQSCFEREMINGQYVSDVTCGWAEEWDSVKSVTDCAWEAYCPLNHKLVLSNDELSCTECNNGIIPYVGVTGTFEPKINTMPKWYQCETCPTGSTVSTDSNYLKNGHPVCLCPEDQHASGQDDNDDQVAAWFDETYTITRVGCVKDVWTICYSDGGSCETVKIEDGTTWETECNGCCGEGEYLSAWCEEDNKDKCYDPGKPVPQNGQTDYRVEPVCAETKNTYKVKYVCIIDGVDVCSGEPTCTEGGECKVESPTFEDKSYYVTEWTCDGCKDDVVSLKPTADLKEYVPTLTNDGTTITLTAQIARCPALYESRTPTYGEYNGEKCTMSAGVYTDTDGNTFEVPKTVNGQEFTCYVETGGN